MRLFFTFIFLSAAVSNSQIFLNELGDVFGDKPYFNQEFIMKKGIKSMVGEYSTKAVLDYIYPSTDFVYFEFNRIGQLVKERRSRYTDTTEFSYSYHSNSLLSRILKRDKYGYHAYTYNYDKKNRLLKTAYYQHRTKRSLKEPYNATKAKLVSEQNYNYMELSTMMYKKIYLNGSGIGYKDEFFYLDEKKKITRQESKLKTGTGRTEVKYLYDDQGRLSEKTSTIKFINEKSTKFRYEYDEDDNVLAIKEYKNDFYLMEYQIVYNPDQTLKAIIKRNVPSNFMTIIKFTDCVYFSKF